MHGSESRGIGLRQGQTCRGKSEKMVDIGGIGDVDRDV